MKSRTKSIRNPPDLAGEIWRPVPGYEGNYAVSSHGRIKRLRGSVKCNADRLRVFSSTKKGYFIVLLHKNGAMKGHLVSRIVCRAFHGEPPSERSEAAHLDGNNRNNHKDNLGWRTPAENNQQKTLHGTHGAGERHSQAFLTSVDVSEIKKLSSSGISQQSIAKQFGISQGHVSEIIAGKKWSALNV